MIYQFWLCISEYILMNVITLRIRNEINFAIAIQIANDDGWWRKMAQDTFKRILNSSTDLLWIVGWCSQMKLTFQNRFLGHSILTDQTNVWFRLRYEITEEFFFFFQTNVLSGKFVWDRPVIDGLQNERLFHKNVNYVP